MAFGQASGPPASAKQIAYLASLLKDAGYETFREARHPFGLTQRQAGGKFTTSEASHLIDRLLGCGTLVISDASTHGQVALPDIPRIEKVQRDLSDLLHELHTEDARDEGV